MLGEEQVAERKVKAGPEAQISRESWEHLTCRIVHILGKNVAAHQQA
jgi:hypothetical protein